MKDLEAEAEKRMQLTRMHDYKGFTIEPIIGGFNIVIYGRKYILYVAGPGGWRLTESMREARAFRDPQTCRTLIDEIVQDWQGWIDSAKGKPVIALPQEQQRQITQEQIHQQQQESNGVVSAAGIKYRTTPVM